MVSYLAPAPQGYNPLDPMHLAPGTKLGPYEIISPLGAGGMGEVYLARDPRLNREVALKILPANRSADEYASARFLREARAASALNHPNIITIYETDSHDGIAYIAMEYVRGQSLAHLLNQRGLPDAEAVAYALQIAEALTKAHATGIVHRDLKPGNVMVTQDGLVKVLDFGLAKVAAVSQHATIGPGGPESSTDTQLLLSTPGSTFGTLSYMSPEQARGDPVDARSDLFSFGVVFFQLLTRKLPFDGENLLAMLHSLHFSAPKDLRYLRPDLSADIVTIVGKCLHKQPDDRYQDAADICRDLRLATHSSGALPISGRLPASATASAASWPHAATPQLSPTQTSPSQNSSPGAAYARTSHAARNWKLAAALSALAIVVIADAVPSIRHGISSLWKNPEPAASSTNATVPDNPVALQRQAQTYLDRWDIPDNVDRSIPLLNRAIELDPNYAPAYASLAISYYQENHAHADPQWVKQASDSAARALQLDNYFADAHIAAGVAAMLNNKFPDAELEFRKAADLDPKSSKPHRWLGYMFTNRGNNKPAEAEIQRAVSLDPKDWHAYMDLGLLYYKTDRFQESAAAWEKVSQLTPDNFAVLNNLAAVYHMLDRYEDAASVLQRSLALRPDAYAYGNLGTLRFFQGRYQDAVPAFEKAVKIAPNEYLWWGNLGDAYRWAPGQAPKAKPAYQTAIRLSREQLAAHPEDLEMRTNLAMYLVKSGDKPSALAEIKDLDRAPDKSASVLFNLAVVHELAGERDQALANLAASYKAGYALKEIKNEPELVALRSDPRYQSLLSESPNKN